jgi:serine-type D-Ala-D-Ala carboxypeptidase (penicillin-binding protein 5/6)
VRTAIALVVVSAVLAATALATAATPAAPQRPSARAWVALDAASGRVLMAQRARELRPIASLTKVMTGLLVAEAGGLGRRVTVPVGATLVEPTNEGLRPGGRYRRVTLLYSAMLVSSNDSATALGYDLGGGSLERFYALMNDKARRIGMRNTVYASASGLDDVHNASTAYDQALLARAALGNATFRRVVSTRRYFTRWAAPTLAKEWVNHNKMLFTDAGTYGVKTGWTSRAGGCVAVAVRHGNRAVILVVLGSKRLWPDTELLVARAFARQQRRS